MRVVFKLLDKPICPPWQSTDIQIECEPDETLEECKVKLSEAANSPLVFPKNIRLISNGRSTVGTQKLCDVAAPGAKMLDLHVVLCGYKQESDAQELAPHSRSPEPESLPGGRCLAWDGAPSELAGWSGRSKPPTSDFHLS